MVTFNRVILAGNLTRDPETRFLPSGVAVTSFSIAVNRRYKVNNEVKEEVSFFDVSVFGKTERIARSIFPRAAQSWSRGGCGSAAGKPTA